MDAFLSHPGIPLETHLAGVASAMRSIVEETFLDGTPASKALFQDIAYVTGLLHDLGKYTNFFQRHLNQDTPDRPESHHACLSAIVVVEIVREVVKRAIEKGEQVEGKGEMLPVIAFMAIRRHHGNLLSARYELNDEETAHFTEWAAVKQQARDIASNEAAVAEISRVYHRWLEGDGGAGGIRWAGMASRVVACIKRLAGTETPADTVKILRRANLAHGRDLRAAPAGPGTRDGKLGWYFLSQLLFSLLVDSDKKFAAKVERGERVHVPRDIVDRYKNDVFGPPDPGSVNELRSRFYDDVQAFPSTPRVDPDLPILSITAPTGIGKTLAVLSFALGLREATERELGYVPRIVYCLPFTSIIDQNHDVIVDVLAHGLPGFSENEERVALKHHHLAKVSYRVDGAELSNDHALAMVESWESEIITTTFVQLFETLLGCSNKALKKFHALVNAIILLDEVQSFPPEYWALLRSCFVYMGRHFNARVVMVTATRPAIFDEAEVQEVLSNPGEYFANPRLDRVTLRADLAACTIPALVSSIAGCKLSSDGSMLVVVNTIPASIELHDALLGALPGAVPLAALEPGNPGWEEHAGTSPVLVYLSTNITPVERRGRIAAIKALGKAGKCFVAVTTQMVEAGVDIDAGMAVRDIGPLDSIIQVSGRCNRNARRAKSTVTIVRLVKPNNRQFAMDVYSPQLLRYAEAALVVNQAEAGIPEATFPRLAREYFSRVRADVAYTEEYNRIVERLEYQIPRKGPARKMPETISDFRLIDDDQQKTDVLVDCCTGSAGARRDVRDALGAMAGSKTKEDYFVAKLALAKAMKALREHVVQVPARYCDDLPCLFSNDEMRVLEGDLARTRYDPATGFKRD